MQLECTQCGSRYAIPDEKVGGRRFRLPCGRCGSWIDVQGPSPAGEAPEDGSFFVNLDGRVFGPLSETGVQALIELGRVQPDTLLWREGLDAWRPAGKGRRAWWLDTEDVGPLIEGFAAMLADWPGHPASLAALESLVRAGRLPDRAAAVLEPALRQVGAWPRLVTLWEDLLPVTDDAARRTQLLLRIGAARADHLADPAGAFDSFAEAFRAAPAGEDALDALERVAEPAQAWERLAHVVAARARDVEDPTLGRRLRLRLARIRAEGLGALDAAQDEVEAVLADAPADADAHILRCALARRADRPAGLAAALADWARVAPAEAGVDALLELAAVRADRLHDADGALEALEAAADVAPTEAVVDALFARFEAGTQRPRVAARLLPALAGAADWARLATVQAAMIDDAAPGPARAAAMRSLADLCHGRLGDADAAFRWLRRAFEEDPTDVEARGAFARRARAEGRNVALVDAWSAVLGGPHGRLLAAAGVEAAAGLPAALQERLVRAALDAAPGALPTGLAAMDRLLSEQQRGLELAEILEQRVEASTEVEETVRLRRRLARLWQGELDGDVEAAAVWRALLVDRPDDLEALEAVLAVTEVSGSAAAHVQAADALLAALPAEHPRGPDLRRRRAHRVADLGDPARAVAAWRAVLVDTPDDAEALAHLERLAREAEDWGAVAEVLSRRLDGGKADADLAFRLGRLFEERLGDAGAAQAAYARALAADAAHGESHRRLARLLEADEQWAPLAALLVERAEHAAGEARRDLRARAADIHAHHLGRPGQALRLRCADLPDADAALAAHDELVALAAQVDGWGVLADRWDAVRRDAAGSPGALRRVALHLADWWTTRLGRPADAEAVLRELLTEDAADDEALDALASVQRRQADWAGLCDTLEARLAAGRIDPTALHLELAELYEGPLGEPAEAIRHLQAAAAEAPGALARLDELLTEAGDWGALDDVLARRVARADGADAARALLLRRGALAVRRDDAAAAVEHYRAASQHGALPVDAANLLADALEDVGDHAALVELLWGQAAALADADAACALRRRAARVASKHLTAAEAAGRWRTILREAPEDLEALDAMWAASIVAEDAATQTSVGEALLARPDVAPERRAELLRAVARAYEGALGLPGRALARWSALVALQPDDVEALERVVALQALAADWAGLAASLQAQAERAPADARADILARLAALQEEKLADADAARATWAALLALDPDHPTAFQRLRALHASAGAWPDLADMLEARAARVDAPVARAALLVEAAEVAELALDDDSRAFRQWLAAFEADGDDARCGEALLRLAQKEQRWGEVVAAYEAAEPTAAVRLRLADLYAHHLGDVGRAEGHLLALLEQQPGNTRVLDRLEALLVGRSDWGGVVDVLERKIAHAATDEGRRVGLLELASAWRQIPGGEENELATVRRLVALDPAEAGAWRTLDRAAERAGDAETRYAARRELAGLEPERAAEHWYEAGALAERALGDADRAIEAFRAALAAAPLDRGAADALGRVCAASGRFTDLAEAEVARLAHLQAAADRRAALTRLGTLYAERLDAPGRAFDAWAEALRLAPGDGAAITALDRLAARTGRWPDFADALRRHLLAVDDDAARAARARQRLAALYLGPLDDPWRARDVLAPLVVDADRETLTLFVEAADRTGDAAGAAGALRQLADRTADTAERIALLRRLGRLYEAELDAPTLAFGAFADLLGEDAADADAQVALARLAAPAGRLEDYAALLEEAWTSVDDRAVAHDLGHAVAVAYRDLLGDEAGAARVWAALLTDDPGDDLALAGLEVAYAARGDWPALADVLGRRLSLAGESERRRHLTLRLADLQANHLGAPDLAVEGYRAVLERRPDDREALEGLSAIFERQQAWGPLFDVLARRVQLDPFGRIARQKRLARLAEGPLERPAEAITRWRALLDARPDDLDALVGLDRLLTRTQDWEALADILAQRAAVQEDEAPELHRRRAQLLQGPLADPAEARRAWEAVRALVPDDRDALEALAALYDPAQAPAALADVQRALLGALPPEGSRAAALRRAHARLLDDVLGDAERAASAWEAVRASAPRDVEALDRLEVLYATLEAWPALADVLAVRADDDARALRRAALQSAQLADPEAAHDTLWTVLRRTPGHDEAFARLDAHYQQSMDWAGQAALLAHRATHEDDPAERRQQLLRLAGVRDAQLGDTAGAFDALVEAFVEAPDPAAGQELERLAPAVAGWATVADVYGQALGRLAAPGWLLRRLAAVQDVGLGDVDAARRTLRRALKSDPEDAEALAALHALLTRLEDWAPLATLLAEQAERTEDAATRRALWARVAGLQAERLARPDEAAATWRRVLAIAPDDAEALAALEALHRAEARWADLAEVHRRQLDAATAPDEALRAGVALADLLRGPLGDPAEAEQVLAQVRAVDPEDRGVLDALGALRGARGDWAGAAEVRGAAAERAPTPAERQGAWLALARDLREHADDADAAFDAFRSALMAAPADPRADAGLVEAGEAAGRQPELATALGEALATLPDGERSAALAERLGALLDGPLQAPADAAEVWTRVLAARPDDVDALAGLARSYAALDRPAEQADVLGRLAERSVGAQRAALLAERARLVQSLGDGEAARAAWTAALAAAPDELEAMRALLTLAEGDAEAAVQARARLLEALPADHAERLPLLRAQAHALEAADAPAEARTHWAALRQLAPGDAEAEARLEALLEATGQWAALVALLEERAALTDAPTVAADALARAAILTESELDDEAAARRIWPRVLEYAPGHPDAVARLTAVYAETGDVEGQVGLLLGQLAHTDEPVARRAVYAQAATLVEEQLASPEHALALVIRAFEETADVDGYVGELERLAERANGWSDLADAYGRVRDRLDGADAVGLDLRLARLLIDRLARPDAAIEAYRHALAIDHGCLPALEALVPLYETRGRHAELVDVLRRSLRTRRSPEGQAAVHRRIARLQAGPLDDAAAATASWREVLRVHPADSEALAALAGLLRGEDRPVELADVLLGQLEAAETAAAEVDLRAELAGLYAGPLDDVARALELLEPALQKDDEHPGVLGALGALYVRAERYAEAVDVFGLQARLLTEPAARRDTYLAVARIWRDHLGEPAQADPWFREVLTLDPHHDEALRAVLERAEVDGRWPDAVRALSRLEAAADDAATKAQLLVRIGQLHEVHLDDPASAADYFAQALVAAPGHVEAARPLARRALKAERWAQALPLLQQVLEATAEGAVHTRRDLHGQIARCAERLGDDATALEHQRAAYALDSTHQPTLEALAELHLRAGVWDEAFKVGQALLLHHGDAMPGEARADALYRQGFVRAQQGDREAAGVLFRKALEADSTHLAARRALTESAPVPPPRCEPVSVAPAAPPVSVAPAPRPTPAAPPPLPLEDLAPVADDGVVAAPAPAMPVLVQAPQVVVPTEQVEAIVERAVAAASGRAAQGPSPESLRGSLKHRVKVVRRPNRRWQRVMYGAAGVALVVAGLAFSGLLVQSYRLQASEEERARVEHISERLAVEVQETQGRIRVLQARLKDPNASPESLAHLRKTRLPAGPLSDQLVELTVRDLEMREELSTVETMLSEVVAKKGGSVEENGVLQARVAELESRLEAIKGEQSAVQTRLATRLDSNIEAITTALSATGIDFQNLIDPTLARTPLVDARDDDAMALGGPFVGDDGYVSPVQGESSVMSPFGPRGTSHHDGIDIPAEVGTPVNAVADGEIIHVQDRPTWESRPEFVTENGKRVRGHGWRAGVYVEVKHDDARVSRYLHLDTLAHGIEKGGRVRAGQPLGTVGRTGVLHSDTHLHFELRDPPESEGGRWGNALDPMAKVHASDPDFIPGTSLLHLRFDELERLETEASAQLVAEGGGASAAAEGAAPATEAERSALAARMDHLQALERMLRDLPLVAPVDDYRVSSPFGRRPDPVTGEWAFHEGIDIPGDERTPVRATAPGTVVFAGEDDQYGFLVEVQHGNGVRTRYGHLYKSLVRQGQRVRYRERIALMGSTGRSTGPHLHYEVIVDGKPRDPMNFIQAGKYIFKR